jgi:hypothetical protein
MQISSGRVVAGRVEIDGELPEGASVTVLAPDGDQTFEADEALEQTLLEAIRQCDRGTSAPVGDLLRDLRAHE